MKILIVTAVYPPEPVVSAHTSADLAGMLLEKGHQVTVFAPYPSRPSGIPYPGYSRRLYDSETLVGVDVIRCLTTLSTESSLVSRLWENLTFGLTSSWRLLRLNPKPDILYANTWPLLAQSLVGLVARLRRIPLMIHIKDIYPESLAAQGRLTRDSWIYRLLLGLDSWIARSSRAVVVIGEMFVKNYRETRRINPNDIYVVQDWVEESGLLGELESIDNGFNPIRQRLGIPEDIFLLVYAGNIGAAAGLEQVLKTIAAIDNSPPLALLIAGEGTRLEACRNLSQELSLKDLYFLSPWPKQDTAAVLASADVLLLPTHGEQTQASLPSKLIYSLIAARPLLAIAQPASDLAHAIVESGCGWVVPPDVPTALAQAICSALQTSPAERQARGAAGRAYALNHFTRQSNLPKLVRILESLI